MDPHSSGYEEDLGGQTDRDKAPLDNNSLKVKVALRIRPLIKRDRMGDPQIAIKPDLNTNMVGCIFSRFKLEKRRGLTLTRCLTWIQTKHTSLTSAQLNR